MPTLKAQSSNTELVEADDDGVLPLVARIAGDPPCFFLKTGRVGGPEGERGSLPVTSAQRTAALRAARSPEAEWEEDPDLGVELLVSGAEGVAEELLVPRFLYRRADRIYEYAAEIPAAKARFDALIGR